MISFRFGLGRRTVVEASLKAMSMASRREREGVVHELRELIEGDGHVQHLFDSSAEIFQVFEDLLVFRHENTG